MLAGYNLHSILDELTIDQDVALSAQGVAEALYDVKTEWEDWLVVVGLPYVKLIEERKLCDASESRRVSFADAYLDEFAVVLALCEVTTDWFCAVAVQHVKILLGVVEHAALKEKLGV